MLDLRNIVFVIVTLSFYRGALVILHANGIEGWFAMGLASLTGIGFFLVSLWIERVIARRRPGA